jgi:four helix bundle protein
MAERLDSYRELRVWQAGMSLAEQCYRLTADFPHSAIYGLTSQIRRAASSIPANVAEGYGRRGRGEYSRFVSMAQGSLCELETHLLLAQRLGFGAAERITAALDQIPDTRRMRKE